MARFHVFVSYARKDNAPVGVSANGWVTAFVQRLRAQHLAYSGRSLEVFFDTDVIGPGVDWRGRLREGLRQSKLFIAFLSPNYRDSEICRWEFEEYLRLEHTLARGDGGVMPIFFVAMPEMFASEAGQLGPELDVLVSEIKRRNVKFDLKDWFQDGADILRELDAEERLAALRDHPKSDRDRRIITLADQMAAIDRAIAKRLDAVALAEIAPGNIIDSYANFVGRARELRDLHKALVQDRIGLVGALYGLGGQGKTALAVQYAYAYAGHYAAGGRWLLECEGKAHLADALEPLAGLIGFELPQHDPNRSHEANNAIRLQHILKALRARTDEGAATLPSALNRHHDIHTLLDDRPELQRHMLLVLDNVDSPELFTAREASGIAGQNWLQVVITTRLDPAQFGAANERLSLIPVEDLPAEDALALLHRLRPFADEDEEQAARAIVDLLGGFTLGVELVGAYLSGKSEINYASYLVRLETEGATGADALAKDNQTAARIRHREKQISRIVEDTLVRLPDAAREVLACATLFPPDLIVVDWLRKVVAARLPELAADRVQPGHPDPFAELMRDLSGRRLLPPSAIRNPYRSDLEAVRLHRLVAAQLETHSDPEEDTARRQAAEAVCETLALEVQQAFPHAPQSVAWAVAPLEAFADRLHKKQDTAATANALSCLSRPVSRLGLFDRGMGLENAALITRRRLLEENPDDVRAKRDLLASLSKLGDFFLRRGQTGDAELALQAYQESYDIRRRLLEENPNDERARRDLSVSLSKLGDFILRRGQTGDADLAFQAYQESLDARWRLLEENPNDARARRDLSVSLSKLGDFILKRGQTGDADLALQAYQESLDIRRRLLEENPNDTRARRDLSVSLSKLGDFILRRGQTGDADLAFQAYEQSLDIRRRLLEENPTDARAKRDLSVSLSKLGDFILKRGQTGDADFALRVYEESLNIRRRLVEESPNDARAKRDLSVSLSKLGNLFLGRGQTGDADIALRAYEECLYIRRRLLEDNPSDARAKRDLSASYEGLASAKLKEGPQRDSVGALQLIEQALDFRLALASANPASEELRREAIVAANQLAAAYDSEGDRTSALGAMARLKQLVDKYREDGFDIHPKVADVANRLHLVGDDDPRRVTSALVAVLAPDRSHSISDQQLARSNGVPTESDVGQTPKKEPLVAGSSDSEPPIGEPSPANDSETVASDPDQASASGLRPISPRQVSERACLIAIAFLTLLVSLAALNPEMRKRMGDWVNSLL